MRIETRVFGGLHVCGAAVARQGDEYDIVQRALLADLTRDIVAAHQGQPDIDQRNIRMFALDGFDGRASIGFIDDNMSHRFQHDVQHLARIVLIFDDQNPARGSRVLRFIRPMNDRVGLSWKPYNKLAAFAGTLALRLNLPAVQFDDLADQSQADAEATR